MSAWTHVTGVISMDGFLEGINNQPTQETIDKFVEDVFGHTVHYNDEHDAWDKCNVPCGSEGSIRLDFLVEPSQSYVGAGQLIVFGNLRDYEDPEPIRKWVEDSLDRMTDRHFSIRGFAMVIHAGNGKSYHVHVKTNWKPKKTKYLVTLEEFQSEFE